MSSWGSGFCAGIHTAKLSAPPPTPPGKSPEFDQHLAEINDKWLFLFGDGDRIVLADVYGDEKQASTGIGGRQNAFLLFKGGAASYSPSGEWAVVWMEVSATMGWDSVFRHYLINAQDLAIHRINLKRAPQLRYPWCVYWLDESTFVAANGNWSAEGFPAVSCLECDVFIYMKTTNIVP